MTKKENQEFTKDDFDDLNEICEECQIKDQSATLKSLLRIQIKRLNGPCILQPLF